ncbi:hypothetical protein CERSUDRAFT_123756 [Gelatoporia subvermispora B]|uniref:Protein kinase domain-containing protein n=1 Tax=Ceriporiopsis subvermispora (strain B) TaxID=914234 RepID=M2QHY2_CERS8|nr:hypothetical protein CERSUDRAFT_123756 [Gelatoporia subvermispora B]
MSKDNNLGKYNLCLPATVRDWKEVDTIQHPNWWQNWENLRQFFRDAGIPPAATSPAHESFGLFGDRSAFQAQFEPVIPFLHVPERPQELSRRQLQHLPLVIGNLNRDVVIKLVAKGEEGIEELRILEYLNSDQMRHDHRNATVPVLDYLQVHDWQFVVMPFCDPCTSLPLRSRAECLEFAEQLLDAVAYLHENRIAHLDISHENILVNHHGSIPETVIFRPEQTDNPLVKIWPPPEWRSTFPVRYLLLDFGLSSRFSQNLPLSECYWILYPVGRIHRAPETRIGKPCNPFAADVYQMARVFYAWFPDVIHKTLGLLKLMQDMSSYNPSRRPSAAAALARLRAIRKAALDDQLEEIGEYIPGQYYLIPRGYLVMLRDLLECSEWMTALQFTWVSLKMRFKHMLYPHQI